MLGEKNFFFFSLLHLINSHLQINLHRTNWVSEDDNIQHDCLQVPAHTKEESDLRQIISYCMGEWPSKFKIKQNNLDQNFTFEQLSKQKITSEQLYLWSAPIDLIEEYQFYLNQLSKSEQTSLATRIFRNCTLPYFGSQCQYVLQDYKSYHSSLDEIVHDYYQYNLYKPTLLTCYMHLECNRGPFPSCLDWTEICNGKIDCLDNGYDEEHCWKMEIQPYNEDDYLFSNRKCISEAFFRDDSNIYNCISESNSIVGGIIDSNKKDLSIEEPTFQNEDISCAKFNNINPEETLQSYGAASCARYRIDILFQAMFSIKPNWLSDECWTALKCKIFRIVLMDPIICDRTIIKEIIDKMCPDIIYIPAVPILMGHIYVAFNKNILNDQPVRSQSKPTYFCYNDQRLYVPNDDSKKLLFDNNTCRFYEAIRYPSLVRESKWIYRYILPLYQWLRINTISIDKNLERLDKSMIYKCMNWSKYISKSRLHDDVIDCPYEDDEEILNKTCPTERNVNYFKCLTTNECIPKNLVENRFCDCTINDETHCDDENVGLSYSRATISFQTMCDGYTHLAPHIIEGQIETDETNCEQWPLIHIYNHCDGLWHSLDGSDEINCDPSPLLNCPTNHHICVSPKTNESICLPIEKVNDGIVDCLGAADEPTLCQTYLGNFQTFYCKRNSDFSCIPAQLICDGDQFCDNNDDEQVCTSSDLSGVSHSSGICTRNYESDGSDVAKILCRRFSYLLPALRVYFTLNQWQNFIKRHQKQQNNLPYQSAKQNVESYQPRCHRGLDLQIWLDKEKNLTRNVCLCPPSYYGDICQYQNQRVSLTLQFRVSSDSVKTPFIIIVSLIDHTDQRIIHSHEQFTYLSIKHCQRRFDVYLLYSTKPKDERKDYSIHIDIYEKTTKLDYRTSFIKSLNFSFLPVHRVDLQINIPRILDNDCSDVQCRNGKCRKYFNDQYNRTFCQCEEGWSGRFCSIPYTSTCSSDSLSLGQLANNRSLCVCPVNKIGPRCLINDITCQNITCSNKGECVLIDEYKTSNKKYICICSKEFTGDQCEIPRTKLLMTFDKNISLPLSILIHFIEVKLNALPVRTTTFKTTSSGQDSMIVYWSLPFHIVFVELENKTYYLAYMQTIYNESSTIESTLNSSDRCLNVSELFNKTFATSSLLRRIKYYHLPCQTNGSQLKCFYDEIHLCLCQQIHQQYVANCFEFDHNISLDCSGQSACENGGRCFQEYTTCPRISVCQCLDCYYGSRCQLSTSGFSLSLDSILGFHIRPNLNISHQPAAVLISLILTLIITLIGLANGILSFITFKNKTTRESGCGIYLFSSSIITLLTMVIFFLKFLILLLSQMGSITNRLFLTIECRSMDFLLRFCLTMDQWLTAFVAIERAFVVTKGVKFNKEKFKSIAKWTISGLVLISMVTNIHDPIYRKLFVEDDNVDDEKRLWCIVQYSSIIQTINVMINIIHFIVPFIINVISALTIIIMSTRQQAILKKKQKYNDILNEQIQQHKNLLIGPCVLIILGVPRLIISFTSGCMKSTSDSWLFLLGYFISLIPPLLTFILFVLPSKTYKQAFRKAISRYRNIIKRDS